MIDTVKLFIESTYYDNKRLISLLSNISYHRNKLGDPFCKGKWCNFTITLFYKNLLVDGSLCKYYFGNNFKTLSRVDIERAIKRLSEELDIDLSFGKVFRLDIANNFIVNRKPKEYYKIFEDSKFFKAICKNTCYLRQKSKQLVFYDKKKELMSKTDLLIDDSIHLLRFELRFMKRVKRQLKLETFYIKDLYDGFVYNKLWDIWMKEYSKLHKKREPKELPELDIETPSDLKEYLAVSKAIEEGELKLINNFISERSLTKVKKYRLKKGILDLLENERFTKASELQQELDNKVIELYNNHNK